MDGFLLLIGHLLGDYALQNDWMARWKTNPPPSTDEHLREGGPYLTVEEREGWLARREWTAFLACTVHCLVYTLAVWACSFWWMPWWGLVACFALHWPVDRFRLAGRWMRNVSGQAAFASGPLAPWSVIVVDNVFHLLTLGVIGAIATRPWGV